MLEEPVLVDHVLIDPVLVEPVLVEPVLVDPVFVDPVLIEGEVPEEEETGAGVEDETGNPPPTDHPDKRDPVGSIGAELKYIS